MQKITLVFFLFSRQICRRPGMVTFFGISLLQVPICPTFIPLQRGMSEGNWRRAMPPLRCWPGERRSRHLLPDLKRSGGPFSQLYYLVSTPRLLFSTSGLFTTHINFCFSKIRSIYCDAEIFLQNYKIVLKIWVDCAMLFHGIGKQL